MTDKQEHKWVEQGRRLKLLYKELDINQESLAEFLDVGQGNVSAVVNGKRGLPLNWIYKLKEKYIKINPDWLISFEGEMFYPEKKDHNILNDPEVLYGNAKELTRKELEKLVLHLSYRVGELEEWKREMEEWKREAVSMIERGKKKNL